jgi:hypothetical protein
MRLVKASMVFDPPPPLPGPGAGALSCARESQLDSLAGFAVFRVGIQPAAHFAQLRHHIHRRVELLPLQDLPRLDGEGRAIIEGKREARRRGGIRQNQLPARSKKVFFFFLLSFFPS